MITGHVPAVRVLLITRVAAWLARRRGLRLLVTPGTILRWHRDIVRRRGPPGPCAARPAGRRPAGTSGPWSSGWPGKIPNGVPQDPRRAGRPGSEGRSVDRMGDPQGQRHRPRPAADRADLVTILALPGRGDPGVRLLHGRPARRHPGLRPGCDRARQQAYPHPRGHSPSHRGLDSPAGPATSSWTSANRHIGSSSSSATLDAKNGKRRRVPRWPVTGHAPDGPSRKVMAPPDRVRGGRQRRAPAESERRGIGFLYRA